MLPVSGAWQFMVCTQLVRSDKSQDFKIACLCSPVAASHNLSAARVFQVGKTWALLEMIGEEDVEKTSSLGLLSQLVHQWWCLPSATLLKLCLHDRLSWHAFCLNPIEDPLNHLNGLRSKLRFRPWWDSLKGWVAFHLD